MVGGFTTETFRPRIGESFRVQLKESRTVELLLVAVAAGDEEANRAAVGLRPPFSIEFRGPHEPLLPQGTYRFEHEALAAFDLFIVPIGRDEESTSYEAVFG